MKINLNQKLKSLDGKPMKQPYLDDKGEQKFKDAEIKDLLYTALLSKQEDATPENKRKEFEIILALNKKDIDLKSEQITFLKEKLIAIYDCFTAGQLELVLEGKEIPF